MPPPPPPGGGSAITATEPKPKRTAKKRINLLIKEFFGERGSNTREFAGNAFGRQSCNNAVNAGNAGSAGNAGNAVSADKAGSGLEAAPSV